MEEIDPRAMDPKEDPSGIDLARLCGALNMEHLFDEANGTDEFTKEGAKMLLKLFTSIGDSTREFMVEELKLRNKLNDESALKLKAVEEDLERSHVRERSLKRRLDDEMKSNKSLRLQLNTMETEKKANRCRFLKAAVLMWTLHMDAFTWLTQYQLEIEEQELEIEEQELEIEEQEKTIKSLRLKLARMEKAKEEAKKMSKEQIKTIESLRLQVAKLEGEKGDEAIGS